jgi:hypothetical protein
MRDLLPQLTKIVSAGILPARLAYPEGGRPEISIWVKTSTQLLDFILAGRGQLFCLGRSSAGRTRSCGRPMSVARRLLPCSAPDHPRTARAIVPRRVMVPASAVAPTLCTRHRPPWIGTPGCRRRKRPRRLERRSLGPALRRCRLRLTARSQSPHIRNSEVQQTCAPAAPPGNEEPYRLGPSPIAADFVARALPDEGSGGDRRPLH